MNFLSVTLNGTMFPSCKNDARRPGNPVLRQAPPDQQRLMVEGGRGLGKAKPVMKNIGEMFRGYRNTVAPGKASTLLVGLTVMCALPVGIQANPQVNWVKNSRSLDGTELADWSDDILKIQRLDVSHRMSAPDSGEEHLDVLMDVLMEDYKNGTEARPEEAQDAPSGPKPVTFEEWVAAKGTSHPKEPATGPACNQKSGSTTPDDVLTQKEEPLGSTEEPESPPSDECVYVSSSHLLWRWFTGISAYIPDVSAGVTQVTVKIESNLPVNYNFYCSFRYLVFSAWCVVGSLVVFFFAKAFSLHCDVVFNMGRSAAVMYLALLGLLGGLLNGMVTIHDKSIILTILIFTLLSLIPCTYVILRWRDHDGKSPASVKFIDHAVFHNSFAAGEAFLVLVGILWMVLPERIISAGDHEVKCHLPIFNGYFFDLIYGWGTVAVCLVLGGHTIFESLRVRQH